ncbi:MAG: magnesium transporter [Nitrospirales bacterium]
MKDLGKELTREPVEMGQGKFDLVLQSFRRLLRRGAITNVGKMLARMHPADIAQVIVHLSSPNEKRTVFELVRGEAQRGQVLSELDPGTIQHTLADLAPADVAWMLKDLGTDDVTYILGVLPEEQAKEILTLMRTEDSTQIADLLKYPKDTSGGIMTTEFFSLSEDTTAQEAIRRLQRATDAEMVFYIYVTDKEEHLVGVLSLRQLLTVPPETPLKNIMTREVISVAVDMDQEEVARQVAQYNLLAIPVVEKDHTLVGIITVDDVVDVIREEATEDMLMMAGASEGDVLLESSSMRAAGRRLPWLFTNLVGSLISGAILWYFRLTIQEVVAIVSFVPVIAAMGGNVGLQSAILIIRGLATGRIEMTDVRKLLFREAWIGLLLGLACGLLMILVSWLWHGHEILVMVVGASLIITFVVSTSVATITPLLLKRVGVDPAVAAGPFVTTVNDITGITIYLTLATALLDYMK